MWRRPHSTSWWAEGWTLLHNIIFRVTALWVAKFWRILYSLKQDS